MQVPLYHTRKWPYNAGSTVSHCVFGEEKLDKDVVKFAKDILCFVPMRRGRLVTKGERN